MPQIAPEEEPWAVSVSGQKLKHEIEERKPYQYIAVRGGATTKTFASFYEKKGVPTPESRPVFSTLTKEELVADPAADHRSVVLLVGVFVHVATRDGKLPRVKARKDVAASNAQELTGNLAERPFRAAVMRQQPESPLFFYALVERGNDGLHEHVLLDRPRLAHNILALATEYAPSSNPETLEQLRALVKLEEESPDAPSVDTLVQESLSQETPFTAAESKAMHEAAARLWPGVTTGADWIADAREERIAEITVEYHLGKKTLLLACKEIEELGTRAIEGPVGMPALVKETAHMARCNGVPESRAVISQGHSAAVVAAELRRLKALTSDATLCAEELRHLVGDQVLLPHLEGTAMADIMGMLARATDCDSIKLGHEMASRKGMLRLAKLCQHQGDEANRVVLQFEGLEMGRMDRQ
ncbi:hypothetical protein LTR36_009969 [Oleoguttula mirabilis]|uniref:Uncharacterized protein n=1 Tax=Oleoguttula mirabilis TaxID=1507867 RepID=A0AAV9J5L0_9PEZI|nr:hypothetical protein LTR36_009969 [Oleoguttula mirabilis]